MSEKYYTKETGWTEAGIAEQERRSELTKLTADEIRVRFDVLRPKMNVPARLVLAEISRRLERLEQCEAALKIYAAEENWQRGRRDGPIDLWMCCDEESWNGPDAARAALEAK